MSAVASEGGNRLTEMVDQQIQSASHYATLLSNTARKGATGLEQEAPHLARMLRSAADRGDELAHMLEEKSYSDMVDAAGRYIRSNPRVFLGGAVAVGFVMARLLKDLSPATSSNGPSRSGQRNIDRFSSSSRQGSQNPGQRGGNYASSEYGSGNSSARGSGQDMTGTDWSAGQERQSRKDYTTTTSSASPSPSPVGAAAIRRGTSVSGDV